MGVERSALGVSELLERIERRMAVSQGGQLVHVEQLAAVAPQYATPETPLPALLEGALDLLGVSQLYTHQVEALESVRRGENVVVVTATSSGKTLCYNLPILEAMLADPEAHALYIYPINALVNDQLKGLGKMNLALGQEAVSIAKYTGSVRSALRRDIRDRNPNILLTNPEMIHLSFLNWHKNWQALWRKLRYVVIDEVHTYRGVFGSNMGHLFRRMLRVARYYGASPQFICCSATIANPRDLCEKLTGLPFNVVDRDGAGRQRKLFCLWNPPLLADQEEENRRRAYAEEAVDLLLHCVRASYNTILFARSRHLTERLLRLSRDILSAQNDEALGERLSAYRAGYLTEEREEIETQLKAGDIRGIITTNALEMGIDIGGLDAAIIAGYPGTVMSTWQQAGRAGRRGREALVLLVASQNPLDQHYMHHPEAFFGSPNELAVIDLENPHIQTKHLLAAAAEVPYEAEEISSLSADAQGIVGRCVELGILEESRNPLAPGLGYAPDRRGIHMQISLRAASHETYRILDDKRNAVGTIEPPNVFREAHPGAIYQHGGDDFRVTYLDRYKHTVSVRPETAPNYTRSSSHLTLHVEQVHETRQVQLGAMAYTLSLGDVLVEETVYSYQELRLGSDEMIRRVNLSQPLRTRLRTTATWLSFGPQALVLAQGTASDAEKAREALGDGLHAIQHLITSTIPLLVMCDQRDVNGYYDLAHGDAQGPTLFLYDACQGGIGLADIGYQRMERLLALAHRTVSECDCQDGCPACIQMGACRLRNESLNKRMALLLLGQMVASESNLEELSSASREVAGTIARSRAESCRRALDEIDAHTRKGDLREHVSSKEEAAKAAEQQPPPEHQYAVGDWVQHSTYGKGVVVKAWFHLRREMLQVRFVRRNRVREVDPARVTLKKL